MEHLYWMHVIPVILLALWPTVDLRLPFRRRTGNIVLHARHSSAKSDCPRLMNMHINANVYWLVWNSADPPDST